MGEFTSDWWLHVQPVFKFLGEHLKPSTCKVSLLEIGSFEGRSSCWFLENWLTHPESSIVCVDTWQGGREHLGLDFKDIEARFDRNTALFGDKVSKIKAPSSRALSWLLQQDYRADFVYIDGSHVASDVLLDLVLTHQIVKSGGVVVCDDYTWQAGIENPLDAPKMAIDAFTQCYYRELVILAELPVRVLGWIKK